MSHQVKVISAHSPVWADQEQGAITLQVVFSHLKGEVPFTATPGDHVSYAKELFARAKAGAFGEIGAYTGPTDEEAQQTLFLAKRAKAVSNTENRISVLERSKKLGMATPDEIKELEAWERYSVLLMRAAGPELPPAPVMN